MKQTLLGDNIIRVIIFALIVEGFFYLKYLKDLGACNNTLGLALISLQASCILCDNFSR